MSSLLRAITPTNLHVERERFLNSASYHPIFRYRWQEKGEAAIPCQGILSRSFLESILNQDREAIVANAQQLFAVTISEQNLADTEAVVSTRAAGRRTPKISEIAAAFRKAFRFFGLNYTVEISKQDGFFFRPDHQHRSIVISEHTELRFFSIDGAVKHEMTHVLRQINTLANSITPIPRFLTTEEGLASYMQDYYGEAGTTSLYQHAAEYVATNIGLNGSLRDIYDFFREKGFSKKLAWQRAARHKFGFVDTRKPGDIMKPSMYYHYEQRVKALAEDERWKLFNGKISIDDLSQYQAYAGHIPLEQLKVFYETKW